MIKKKKNKFDFKCWKDYLLFMWIIAIASLVGIVASEYSIAFVYFTIGLFTSLVCALWVKRNSENWGAK